MANGKYTIKDLTAAVSITSPTFYNLIKRNSDFKELLDKHTTNRGRQKFFDEEVLTYLKDYYLQEGGGGGTQEQAAERQLEAVKPPIDDSEVSALRQQLEAAENDCKVLQMKVDTLTQETEVLRDDKQHLEQTVNQLLMLLEQEKREKMLYLPKPRRTLAEVVKGLFKKEGGANETI